MNAFVRNLALATICFGLFSGCSKNTEKTDEDILSQIECVLRIDNTGKKFFSTIRKLRADSEKRSRFFSKLSSNDFPELPATDFKNNERPEIYYFVISYYDCQNTIERINSYYMKRYKALPQIVESDLDTYKLVYQGKNVFEERVN